MSDKSVHEEQCRRLLGKSYSEVHEFLDQGYQPLKNVFQSHLHRKRFHHWEGVGLVIEKFGQEAGWAAMIHILEDCLGYIPDREGYDRKDYEIGAVDEYGRPKDPTKLDTGWFNRLLKSRSEIS